jgi:hypothetical protein
MSRKLSWGGIITLALLLVSLFGFAVLAAENNETADMDNSDKRAEMGVRMQADYQNYIAQLAVNLGVTEDTLTAALEKTQQEILAAKVASGDITQEQADKMAERGIINLNYSTPGAGEHNGSGGPDRLPPDAQSAPAAASN